MRENAPVFKSDSVAKKIVLSCGTLRTSCEIQHNATLHWCGINTIKYVVAHIKISVKAQKPLLAIVYQTPRHQRGQARWAEGERREEWEESVPPECLGVPRRIKRLPQTFPAGPKTKRTPRKRCGCGVCRDGLQQPVEQGESSVCP